MTITFCEQIPRCFKCGKYMIGGICHTCTLLA